jgi:hypothetical protein
LSDSNGELAKAMGIAFQALKTIRPFWQGSDGLNSTFLQALFYLVNLDGKIDFEYITL